MSSVPTCSSSSFGKWRTSFLKAVVSFQHLNKQAATTPASSVSVGIALVGLKCLPHVVFRA